MKRQPLEQSVSMPTEASSSNMIAGSGSEIRPGLQRLNTNSLLFPRNNLIDGVGSSECNNNLETSESKQGLSEVGGSSHGKRSVRICQLKDMRRQATFAQEQMDFVGKLTSQQQAVRLPSSNAEQINTFSAAAGHEQASNVH